MSFFEADIPLSSTKAKERGWVAKIDLAREKLKFLSPLMTYAGGTGGVFEVEEGQFYIAYRIVVSSSRLGGTYYTLYKAENNKLRKIAEIVFREKEKEFRAENDEFKAVLEDEYKKATTYRTTTALIKLAKYIAGKEGNLPPVALGYKEFKEAQEKLKQEGRDPEKEEREFYETVRFAAVDRKLVEFSRVFSLEELGEKTETIAAFDDPLPGKSGEAYMTSKGALVVIVKPLGEKPQYVKLYYPKSKMKEAFRRADELKVAARKFLAANGIKEGAIGGDVVITSVHYDHFEIEVQKYSNEVIEKIKAMGGKFDPHMRRWHLQYPPQPDFSSPEPEEGSPSDDENDETTAVNQQEQEEQTINADDLQLVIEEKQEEQLTEQEPEIELQLEEELVAPPAAPGKEELVPLYILSFSLPSAYLAVKKTGREKKEKELVETRVFMTDIAKKLETARRSFYIAANRLFCSTSLGWVTPSPEGVKMAEEWNKKFTALLKELAHSCEDKTVKARLERRLERSIVRATTVYLAPEDAREVLQEALSLTLEDIQSLEERIENAEKNSYKKQLSKTLSWYVAKKAILEKALEKLNEVRT